VIGWSLGRKKDVRLTLQALDRAAHRNCPPSGLIFHSDRGTEYAGYVFRDRLVELGIVQSTFASTMSVDCIPRSATLHQQLMNRIYPDEVSIKAGKISCEDARA
jgi:hypothetical protein